MQRLDAPEPGCWMHAVAPSEEDLAAIRRFGVPLALLSTSTTSMSVPVPSTWTTWWLVVLHCPLRRGEAAGAHFVTSPLSRVPAAAWCRDGCATAGRVPGRPARRLGCRLSTTRTTEFVLRIFWQLADAYLAGGRQINASVEHLQDQLKRSLRTRRSSPPRLPEEPDLLRDRPWARTNWC